MRPGPSPQADPQGNLFKLELRHIVNHSHALVRLAHETNWQPFDEMLGASYSDMGRPGVTTRLMVALHYLKYQHDLSDEAVVAHWVENPYWQYFSGIKYFEHDLPIEPSSMTKWRKRIGEQGAESLLKETIEKGVRLKVITTGHLEGNQKRGTF
jgi:transposase, IS5 family